MAAFFSDTFTGTTGTLLQSHVPDVGGGWTKFFSTTATDDFALSSGVVVGGSNLANVSYYVGTAGAGSPDVSVSVDIKRINVANTTIPGSLVLRYVSPTVHYRVDVTQTTVSLVRVDGGTTTLASASWPGNLNINHTLRVDVSGNTFSVYSDNVTCFTYTDNAVVTTGLTTSDKVGLGGNGYTQFDNFSASQFVAQDFSGAFLKDTFVGTLNAKLETHTPDSGGTWAPVVNSDATTYGKLSGGDGYVTGNNITSALYNLTSTPAKDVIVQADVTRVTSTTQGAATIVVRQQADTSRYEFRVSAGGFSLWRIAANGAGSNPVPSTGSDDTNAVMRLRVEAVGNIFKLYKNEVLIFSFTDVSGAAINNAGYVGLGISQHTRFDNVYARTQSSVASGTGASTGLTTVAAEGVAVATKSADAASTGTATASGAGVTFHVGFGSSDSSSLVQAVGLTLQFHTGDGASAGSASSVMRGQALFTGVGSSVGGGDAFAESNSLAKGEGIGRSLGSAYALAEASALGVGVASSTGNVSTPSFRGSWTMDGIVAEAAGSSSAAAVYSVVVPGELLFRSGTAFAAGSSAADFHPVLPAVAKFTLDTNTATVIGRGSAIASAIAAGGGTVSTATADGSGIRESVGRFLRRAFASFIALVTPVDTVVPPDRTITLSAEPRTITPAREDRTVILSADLLRRITLTAENRTLTL